MKLEVRNGSFSYKPEESILEHINFSVSSGELMTILGKNGIGKTTLLKCMMGLLKWKEGEVLLDGMVMREQDAIRHIAYVPQAHKVSFPYRALDMVCMGRTKQMGFFAVPSEADKEKAMESLKEVGMEEYAGKECNAMSGGQLQLVFMARALVSKPEILILDEPESHLDFKNQCVILDLVEHLVKEKGMLCIMNTHYPEHALKRSHKTLLLGKGESVFGKTEEVLTSKTMEHFFDVRVELVDLAPLGYKEKTFLYETKRGENK